jgi:spore coat protein H
MKLHKLLITTFILLLSIISCSQNNSTNTIDTSIADNTQVYENDSLSNIKEVYITVLEPKKNDKKYNYTLYDLNTYYDAEILEDEPELKVIFQEGRNGVIDKDDFGFGLSDSNGIMELRGQSSRIADLKSYKIKLNSKTPWDGFETVNLNKHPFDDLRIRNKLTFELIKEIDNITSARTQFVHLYVRDYSEGNYSNDFVDYGLFTHIENIDTEYLDNHDLDKNGYLYKVENFEFKRYEDILLDVDDNDYDEDEFENVLEIKGVDDHKKLLQMLDAVNNDRININEVIDTYFDRDNFVTWLALNIITDNVDTQSRNYFLYSPLDSPTWYFLPWDYDKGLGGYSNTRPIWTRGVSNYWGIILVNRFLRNDNNLIELTNKVEELYQDLDQEKVNNLVDLYKPIAKTYLNRYPDNLINDLTDEEIDAEFENLRNSITTNKNEYYKSLERPMPVFLNSPFVTGNFIEFDWSDSYDFMNDDFYYSFELSDKPDFSNIIYQEDKMYNNELIIKKLAPGEYFYRVVVTNSKGNHTDAFDIYLDDETLSYYYGVKQFVVI